MITFVLDTDGLIKLTKSGVMEELAKYRKCLITQDVFNEAVKQGKERLYEDAYAIEDLIDRKLLSVEKINFEEINNLGKGEASSLAIYKKKRCNAIITDDRKFLSVLEEQRIPFIMPVDVILGLLKRRKITTKMAFEALEKMKLFIREELYTKAKNEIGD
ncbi:MAG: hypothetical protein HYT72_03560 [Candidatus Aenigmarchaeota archaeon]|nr:hypothetical protein [Candidatus Aenigmarchaeota archaeon]